MGTRPQPRHATALPAVVRSVTMLLLIAGLAPMLQAQGLLQERRSNTSLISERLQGDLLPVEEAFRLQLQSSGSDGLLLQWQIAPGHYLYRKSLRLQLADGSVLEGLELPDATPIEDAYFGAVDVYYEELRLELPLARLSTAARASADNALQLEVHFQGCAEDRYCYPPHRQTLAIPSPFLSRN